MSYFFASITKFGENKTPLMLRAVANKRSCKRNRIMAYAIFLKNSLRGFAVLIKLGNTLTLTKPHESITCSAEDWFI